MAKHRRALRALKRLQARAARGDQEAQAAVVVADQWLGAGGSLLDVVKHRSPVQEEMRRTRARASQGGTRCPNTEALVKAFRITRAEANLIRKIAKASSNNDEIWRVTDGLYNRRTYNYPRSKMDRVRVMLNALSYILGMHGVEPLGPIDMRRGPPFEYLNAGDTYATTLIYDRDADALRIGTWGDVVEQHPEWEDPEWEEDR